MKGSRSRSVEIGLNNSKTDETLTSVQPLPINALFSLKDADVCDDVNINKDTNEDLQGAVGGVVKAEVTEYENGICLHEVSKVLLIKIVMLILMSFYKVMIRPP